MSKTAKILLISLISGVVVIYATFGFFGKKFQIATINLPSNSSSTGSNTSTTATSGPIVQNPSSTPVFTPPSTSPNPTSTPNPGPTPSEIVYGNRSKKQVIFTFDGGGVSDESAADILAALAKHNSKATFFVTGDWANKFPSTVRAIDAAGHEIFNHTLTHPYLTKISDFEIKRELNEAEIIISNLTGETTNPYFRPPYGDRNQHVRDVAWSAGYRNVYWSTDAWDWRESWTDEMVKQRIRDGLTPGAIYLMHIGDGITGRILDGMLSEIESQGYSIVTLTQGLR